MQRLVLNSYSELKLNDVYLKIIIYTEGAVWHNVDVALWGNMLHFVATYRGTKVTHNYT